MAYRRRRSRWRKAADYFSAAVFVLAVIGVTAWLTREERSQFTGPFMVIDGDSLQDGGDRLRLSGIDAPENSQTCWRPENGAEQEWPCGREAKRHLRQLTGANIICRGSERDRYQRVLVRCMRGETDIAGEMVWAGLAVAGALGEYGALQRRARSARRGIWAGRFDLPADWREAHGGLADDLSGVNATGIVGGILQSLRAWLPGDQEINE